VTKTPISIALVTALLLLGYGCDDCSGSSESTAAPEEPDMASKIVGDWDLSMESALASAPEDKVFLVRLLHLTFREEPPTDADFERFEVPEEQRDHIRAKRLAIKEDPMNPLFTDARNAYNMFLKSVPKLKITKRRFGLHTHKRQTANPYKVLEQTKTDIRIEVSDAQSGGIDRFKLELADRDRISVLEDGSVSPLVFERHKEQLTAPTDPFQQLMPGLIPQDSFPPDDFAVDEGAAATPTPDAQPSSMDGAAPEPPEQTE
jgi:hypothetical protein